MPLLLALIGQRQADVCKFKANLTKDSQGHTEKSCLNKQQSQRSEGTAVVKNMQHRCQNVIFSTRGTNWGVRGGNASGQAQWLREHTTLSETRLDPHNYM